MAPIWPLVAPIVMTEAGEKEQSKLDGHNVEPVSGLVCFWFGGLYGEKFSSVCLIRLVLLHSLHQLLLSRQAGAERDHSEICLTAKLNR